jgi:hypothetical protein
MQADQFAEKVVSVALPYGRGSVTGFESTTFPKQKPLFAVEPT